MLYNRHDCLRDRIDRSCRAPLHVQIAHAIILDIEHGKLAPGAWLPSSRYLAEIIGTNRKAVVSAYTRLIAQGWLTSLGTRGTAVAARPGAPAIKQPDESRPCGIGYRYRRPRPSRESARAASAARGASPAIQTKDQQ